MEEREKKGQLRLWTDMNHALDCVTRIVRSLIHDTTKNASTKEQNNRNYSLDKETLMPIRVTDSTPELNRPPQQHDDRLPNSSNSNTCSGSAFADRSGRKNPRVGGHGGLRLATRTASDEWAVVQSVDFTR